MAVLMAVKLINNILTLFFGENGCKKDGKSQYFIMRETVIQNMVFAKILEKEMKL